MDAATAASGYGPVEGQVLHAHTGTDGVWHAFPDDEDHVASPDCPCGPFRTGTTWLHWARIVTAGGDCGCD